MVRQKLLFVLLLFFTFLFSKSDIPVSKKFEGTAVPVRMDFSKSRKDFTSNTGHENGSVLSSELINMINAYNSAKINNVGRDILKFSEDGNEVKTPKPVIPIYLYLKDQSELYQITNMLTGDYTYNSKYKLLAGKATVPNLTALGSKTESIRHIRSVIPPVSYTGSTITEGDAVHQTDLVRSTYGTDGIGIKVGIISNGVDSRLTAQISGDLPADGSGLTVLSNVVGGEEGTAMLEIVHDMVPGAELYFHDCGTNWNQFNTAIDNLVAAGCDIICDDIGWLTVPFFEDGIIASHLANVISSNNIIYTSSAGNAGYSHHQSQFYPLSGYPNYHDFSAGGSSLSDMYFNLNNGGNATIILEWNDPFGGSGNNYDLYLYSYSSGSIVATSNNIQDGNDDPLEFIVYTANALTAGDFAIWVYNTSATGNETIEVFDYLSGGSFYTNNTSPVDAIFGHSAANGVISCAAAFHGSPSTVESFSSQGPSTITYPSPESRQTPKITGVDGVSVTGAGGFPNTFYGTSAAAPHVAAVAAMIWSHDPDFDRDDVIAMLYGSAVDIGAGGFDNVFGYGRADAYRTYQDYSLPVELQNFACFFDQGIVRIQWQTASEVNNRGFIIERKESEIWVEIATYQHQYQLQGQGNSSTPFDYTYVDDEIMPGKTYQYRIIDVDMAGNRTVHDECIQAVKIPEELYRSVEKFALNAIYPNPFNPSTNISYQLAEKSPVLIQIFNLKGELIETLMDRRQSAGIHRIPWNASDNAGGIYIIQITNGKRMISEKCLLIK